MGAFRYDNPLMTIMVRIANLMLLSFYWVVCCLPLVTAAPASAALYHSICKVVRTNGNGVTRDFFRTFKNEFKTGVCLTLICTAAAALLGYGLFLGGQFIGEGIFGIIHFAVGAILVMVLLPTVLYVPPVLSRFRGSASMILRLSLFFSSQHPVRNLVMLVLLALIVFLVDFYPVLLMLLPAVYADMIATGMEKIMNRYAEEKGLLEDTSEEQTDDADQNQEMTAIGLDRYLTQGEEVK